MLGIIVKIHRTVSFIITSFKYYFTDNNTRVEIESLQTQIELLLKSISDAGDRLKTSQGFSPKTTERLHEELLEVDGQLKEIKTRLEVSQITKRSNNKFMGRLHVGELA
jgi:hypothetical protein